MSEERLQKIPDVDTIAMSSKAIFGKERGYTGCGR
jgi:hypothetical protein